MSSIFHIFVVSVIWTTALYSCKAVGKLLLQKWGFFRLPLSLRRINTCSVFPSCGHMPAWRVPVLWWDLHPWQPAVWQGAWLQGHEWWAWVHQWWALRLDTLNHGRILGYQQGGSQSRAGAPRSAPQIAVPPSASYLTPLWKNVHNESTYFRTVRFNEVRVYKARILELRVIYKIQFHVKDFPEFKHRNSTPGNDPRRNLSPCTRNLALEGPEKHCADSKTLEAAQMFISNRINLKILIAVKYK